MNDSEFDAHSENESGDAIESINSRVRKLEWIAFFFVVGVLGALALPALFISLFVQQFETSFQMILGDKPLPGITRFVLGLGKTGMIPIISGLLPILAVVFLSLKRDSLIPWFVAISLIAILVLLIGVVVIGLSLPWVPYFPTMARTT